MTTRQAGPSVPRRSRWRSLGRLAGWALAATVWAMWVIGPTMPEPTGLADDDPRVRALSEEMQSTLTAPVVAGSSGPDHEPRDDASGYAGGPVRCEAIPPDFHLTRKDDPPALLTSEEVEDATCVMAPQPDGTSVYAAIAPDGTVRAVRLDSGTGARLPDQQVDLPEGANFEVDENGTIMATGKRGQRLLIEFD